MLSIKFSTRNKNREQMYETYFIVIINWRDCSVTISTHSLSNLDVCNEFYF